MGKFTKVFTFHLAICAALVAGVAPVHAAEPPVPVDCDASGGAALQAAIDTASSGQTIQVSGTCQTTPVLIPGRGNFASFRVPAGKDIILLGVSGDAVLDGQDDGIVLWIDAEASVEVKNMLVTNGNGKYTLGDVGGINNEGDLILKNSSVTGNTGQNFSTGGLANQGSGTLLVINSSISGNTTGAFGTAGMVTVGPAVIRNSLVEANVGGFSTNGGLSVLGPLSIKNSVISENIGGGTGGLFAAASASLDATNSKIVSNQGGAHGGIFSAGATIILKNTEVAFNQPDNCSGFGDPGCA